MAVLLPWLSRSAWVALAVACVLLVIDARGQRKALGATHEVIAALRHQVRAHDEQIGNLARALALLTPPEARPTTAAPKPAIPSETAEVIRARFEAEADARSEARGELRDAEPDDERTRVYSGRVVRKRTLVGLAGAPSERPEASPTHATEAFRAAHSSSPTLVSEGIEPPPGRRE